MGNTQSNQPDPNYIDDAKECKECLEKKGLEATVQFIKTRLDKWKKEKVIFAVVGGSASGKSTFINSIRNVTKTDKGFAASGYGDTTMEPQFYDHPNNKRFQFVDLPGFGTTKIRKENYVTKMKLADYDYFLIFFHPVLREDDEWIATELNKMKKPFSFIRSQVDVAFDNAKRDGIPKDLVIPGIKEKAASSIKENIALKSTSPIFVISSTIKTLGDWDKLIDHMNQNLPKNKSEVMIFSLSVLTVDIIEAKYNTLFSRIGPVCAAIAGISAIVPLSLDINAATGIMVAEMTHQIKTFGLDYEQRTKLQDFRAIANQLKHRAIFIENRSVLEAVFGGNTWRHDKTPYSEMENVWDGLIPFRYTKASYRAAEKCLESFLNALKEDAIKIYTFNIEHSKDN